ncbi:MAG: hypothetical protein Q7T05_04145 [Dehalococcoidia bacterium]|nr:hypothetical protein [Dehalococcoidia bacterium]
MLRMSAHTKATPQDVVNRAIEFFNRKLEMKIIEQSPTCVYFQDNIGKVDVVSCVDKKGTTVELASVEWDNEVREFVKKLP